jgi:hypothetical protein
LIASAATKFLNMPCAGTIAGRQIGGPVGRAGGLRLVYVFDIVVGAIVSAR